MSRPLNPWKLSGYKAGQSVVCRVRGPEPGGYSVTIPKDNLPGFLPTQAHLKAGEEILAQFVCVHNNRILLLTRFAGDAGNPLAPGQKGQPVRWEDQLKELDDSSVGISSTNISSAENPQVMEAAQNLPGAQGEPDAAFRVWASHSTVNLPKLIELKRAVDLILPPLHTKPVQEFKIKEYDLEWLITDLEGGMRTCCLKTANEDVLSRSAILLYRGRAVGCVYSCKKAPEPPLTEEALQKALTDLNLPNTSVAIYDLPESLAISSSALFLGYPVPREDDYEARAYMDYICGWFEGKSNTACLTFTFPKPQGQPTGHCFAYVYRGQVVGTFNVEEQVFSQDKSFIYKKLEQEPNAELRVDVLPPEMTSSAVRFGFSLSMARKQMSQ